MFLINDKEFNGYPVIHQHGPLVQDILIAIELMMAKSFCEHKRLAVFRFELKFPGDYIGTAEVISKFIDSLRFRTQRDLSKKSKSRGRAIYSVINYLWVKELSGSEGWHYHFVLVLNYDVYNCFGKIGSKNNNMYKRILASWASAIECSENDALGLVHLPKNSVYKLDKNSLTFGEDINAVLFRLSYLAKLKTKPYGSNTRRRFYGTSKRKSWLS
ncbi:inovirus Gp2 family protein [Vibrio agarivorans]|uniref:inovirus Gp2 family protein n=1 Tax=Vibrio agarivorans TaxID=153622 RepID=UPI0025B35757|nr:inovirus Gp2 family protein [Vibrio agarivorans]MDN3660463.1 inovirus Gp2 family protein [Vibrio agarivorans]